MAFARSDAEESLLRGEDAINWPWRDGPNMEAWRRRCPVELVAAVREGCVDNARRRLLEGVANERTFRVSPSSTSPAAAASPGLLSVTPSTRAQTNKQACGRPCDVTLPRPDTNASKADRWDETRCAWMASRSNPNNSAALAANTAAKS